jgi:hypothetical protein
VQRAKEPWQECVSPPAGGAVCEAGGRRERGVQGRPPGRAGVPTRRADRLARCAGAGWRWRQLVERRALAAAAAWLVSAAVLCVCVARMNCVLGHPPCLTAHGEHTWLGWAYRHPDPQELFRRIGSRLRPGEPIVIVARQAEQETYWWRGMASYFLWDHAVNGLRNLDRLPRVPGVGQALVIVSDLGAIDVRRQKA